MLTKESILKADDLPKELVEVPEWHGQVWVSTLTKALGDKSAAALDRCFAVAQRLNGFSSDDVEDLAGN